MGMRWLAPDDLVNAGAGDAQFAGNLGGAVAIVDGLADQRSDLGIQRLDFGGQFCTPGAQSPYLLEVHTESLVPLTVRLAPYTFGVLPRHRVAG